MGHMTRANRQTLRYVGGTNRNISLPQLSDPNSRKHASTQTHVLAGICSCRFIIVNTWHGNSTANCGAMAIALCRLIKLQLESATVLPSK